MRRRRSLSSPVTSFLALSAGLLALLSLQACRQGVPVFDPGSKPSNPAGTISGTVRGPANALAIEGRTVEIVNIETGARERTATSATGGFTFKVRPGKYRVVLTLLEGESLVKQPGVITVNRSDVDAHADFVVSTSRIVRPRFAAPRFDNSLGSPIA